MRCGRPKEKGEGRLRLRTNARISFCFFHAAHNGSRTEIPTPALSCVAADAIDMRQRQGRETQNETMQTGEGGREGGGKDLNYAQSGIATVKSSLT